MSVRLKARKYAMSLAEVAARTGESLSSIKRKSAKYPALFAAKVQALLDMKPAAPMEPVKPDPEWNYEISTIVNVHFELAALRWSLRDSNPDIYNRLTAILERTRPYVEEPVD